MGNSIAKEKNIYVIDNIKKTQSQAESTNTSDNQKTSVDEQLKNDDKKNDLSNNDTNNPKAEADDIENEAFYNIINDLFHNLFLNMNKHGYFSINSPAHQNIECDACSKTEFIVDRYKCLVCKDYDLCGMCFESRKISAPHVKGHPMIRYSGPKEIFGDEIQEENVTLEKFKIKFNRVEHEATCNGCKSHPIFGLRFKCDECYDFDLCYECFEKNLEINDHKKDHSVLVCYSIRNVDLSDIEFLDCLGQGAFGKAHKAKIISKNKLIVCKVIKCLHSVIDMGSDYKMLYKSFIREILAYNEINSSYVIKAYGSCVVSDKIVTKLYLLTEYMEKGSLTNLLENEPDLSYRCRLAIACNIASGMKRIHEKHYIHRDIRPDNIFITENYVAKIGDMGISRLQDKFQNHTIFGPIKYMPNEFFTGNYNEKVDIYSFGLTIYHLITGQMHESIKNKVELRNEPIILSKLINECLENLPSNRPTALDLEKNLELHYKVLMAAISNATGYFLFPKEKRTELCIKVCNLVSQLL